VLLVCGDINEKKRAREKTHNFEQILFWRVTTRNNTTKQKRHRNLRSLRNGIERETRIIFLVREKVEEK
jgi:hypothetical protein